MMVINFEYRRNIENDLFKTTALRTCGREEFAL